MGDFDIFFPFWMLPLCPMIENMISKLFHPFSRQTTQACYQNPSKNYMRIVGTFLIFTEMLL
jgi:hypothetical protein